MKKSESEDVRAVKWTEMSGRSARECHVAVACRPIRVVSLTAYDVVCASQPDQPR